MANRGPDRRWGTHGGGRIWGSRRDSIDRGESTSFESNNDRYFHQRPRSRSPNRDPRERDSRRSCEVRQFSPRRDSRERNSRTSYEVRRSRYPKSPHRDSRGRGYRSSYGVRRFSPRRDSRERYGRRAYGVRRSRSPEVVYSRERDSWRPYEVRRSRSPKSPRRNARGREYRRSYEVGRSRPQKSPRRDSQKRDSRGYEVRRPSLDSVPPATVTPTGGSMSVQPKYSRRSYEVRQSRSPKSPRRDSREREYRGSYRVRRSRSREVRRSRSPKSPRRYSRERDSRISYEVRRSGASKSPHGERDSRERDSRERDSQRSYAVRRSRSPCSALKERESRKGANPYQKPLSGSIEPNIPQKPIPMLGPGGRLPYIGELVLIRMPYEDVIGRLSVTLESGTISTGKQSKQPKFHPVIISNYGKGSSGVEIQGFLVRSFTDQIDPVQHIDGKPESEKDLLLPMPSKTPAATPPAFGAPITMTAYMGLKTQRLCAHELHNTFEISQCKVCLYQSIWSRELKLITTSIVQALLTHSNHGWDRTRTNTGICIRQG